MTTTTPADHGPVFLPGDRVYFVGGEVKHRPGSVTYAWQDTSRAVRNKRVAVGLMFARNDDALWDMARMVQTRNKVKARRVAGRPIYTPPGQA